MTIDFNFKWILTQTFEFNDNNAEYFYEFDNAKKYANLWSKETQAPIYLWKVTTGNPIKWMEVSS